MKRLLTFLTLLTLFFGVGWAETKTATLQMEMPQTSPVTVNGVTFTWSSTNIITGATNSGSNGFKANSNMTVTLPSGATLTGISKTNGSNWGSGATIKVYQGSNNTGTNIASIVTGTNTYTITSNNTGGTFYFENSTAKNAWIRTLTITYETSGGSSTTYYNLIDGSSNGNVAFTVGGATVTSAESGATVTATATATDGYEFSSWTVPTNVTNWNADGSTATFTMPTADVTVTANFTEQPITGGDTYELVTKASDLVSGAEYLITNADGTVLMGAMAGSNATYANQVTTGFTTNTDNTITLGSSCAATPLTLGGSSGAWTLNNGSGYIAYTNTSTSTSGNNNLWLVNDASTNGATWNITIPESSPHSSQTLIVNVNNSVRSIRYNATNTRFAGYATGQAAIALYKKVEPVIEKTYDVTVTQSTGGTITANPVGEKVVDAGDKISVTATPDPGYELSSWTITGAQESEPDANNQITATGDVTITATFSKVELAINRIITTNGANSTAGGWLGAWQGCETVGEANSATGYTVTAFVGETVSFKAGTNNTYQILDANVTAVDGNNDPVVLTKVSSDGSGTVFSFTMPSTSVTITANFTDYRGTIRLAGRFNGNTDWRTTGTNEPAFTYDSANDKYTIDAYFTGEGDGNYFFITYDKNALHPNANGNWSVTNTTGTPISLSWGGSSNFAIENGVFTIEIPGDLSTIAFTKQEPTLTFNPASGEVEQGTSVSATSNLTTLIGNIKANDSGAAGEVTVGVNTDNGNTWNASETLNTIGSAIIYGKAYISNISVTGQANYNIVAENTNTQYQLINSTDDLVAGKRYIIVSTGSYTASGTTYNFTKAATVPNANNNLILDEDVTISSDIVDLSSNSNVTEFILGGTTDAWTFAFGDGTYLASTAAKSACASNTATPASISFSGDNATIYMNSTVGNFQYNPNNGNGRFAAYTSTQKPVMLFKQVEGTITQKSAAPEILPEGGNIVGFSQELTMTQDNGGTIHYTMTVGDQPNVEPADPADPTEASTQYDPENKPWAEVEGLGYIVKIKAVAKEVGKELSNPVSVRYLFVAPATPNFTPGANTYTTPQTVSLSTTTANADIYYTTNSELEASQFVTQGTKFEEPFTVSETTTYYAVAVYHDTHANKDAISGIRQAAYEIEAVPTVRPNYTESLTGGKGKFSVENEEGTTIDVWTQDAQWGMKGTSYVNNYNYKATSWLLSPNIDLTDAVTPVLSFDHQINKYFNNPSTQATLWVSVDGGEWEPIGIGLPSSKVNDWTSYEFSESISAYNGHIVRFGFKYNNPTAGTGAGTWEIQNFSVTDENIPPIEVNNIAEFMDNTIVPEGSKAKLLNPVVVLYHYQQYHNEDEGDYVNDYIWVKDESGYAIIYGKYLDVNYTNGDIIPAGFTATKFYYNVGRFYQMYYPEGLQAATQKTLADPEPVTLKILNDNKNDYNGHYVTIPKMQIKFSSGELVSYTYNFETEDSYGGQRNFEIGDASLSLTSNNKSIIGYNNFDNPWLETLDYPEFENTTEVYGDYNITGIFERYNNNWEFMPIIITPWEEQTMTLHDLCEKGVEQQTYTISNPLQVVYVDTDNNSVWVKDDNGQSIWKTSPEAPNSNNFAIDYPDNTRSEQKYYDQSNWCQLKFDGEIPSSFAHGPIINGRKINGTFTNKLNPTLENVTIVNNDIDLVMAPEASYDPNYYVAANFSGPQLGYFFMNPKPQEYAHIVWAIYDGANMNMPSNTSQNPNEFTGSFKVDMSMNSNPSLELVDGTETGMGYEHFTAIIRLMSTTSGAPMLKGAPEGTEYVVFPLDITQDVPTAINDLFTGNGEVKSVKFYNVAGIESNVPFQGVNIVVTEYTDGSRTTTKMLKR